MKKQQKKKEEKLLDEVRIILYYHDGTVTDFNYIRASSLKKVEKDTGVLGKLVREEIQHL